MAKKEDREPEFYLSPLNNQMLNYKEYYMSTSEKILFFCLIFAIGGFVGQIFYGGLFKSEGEATLATYISNCIVFCLVGGIAAKVFLPMINSNLKEKRDKKLKKQFMDMLEGIAASLSAGNTVNDSFFYVKNDLLNQYSEGELIITELTEINNGIGNNGKTLEEMLESFGERSGIEDIVNFSNVMSNCYRLGGDFKSVVRRTRDIIGDKMAINDEIDTKLASNKLQHNAMCIMPIALVAMLKITNKSFATNLTTPVGVIVTTIAIGIFIASYFWGQKIIKIR